MTPNPKKFEVGKVYRSRWGDRLIVGIREDRMLSILAYHRRDFLPVHHYSDGRSIDRNDADLLCTDEPMPQIWLKRHGSAYWQEPAKECEHEWVQDVFAGATVPPNIRSICRKCREVRITHEPIVKGGCDHVWEKFMLDCHDGSIEWRCEKCSIHRTEPAKECEHRWYGTPIVICDRCNMVLHDYLAKALASKE